jgi:hypothetical protein
LTTTDVAGTDQLKDADALSVALKRPIISTSSVEAGAEPEYARYFSLVVVDEKSEYRLPVMRLNAILTAESVVFQTRLTK